MNTSICAGRLLGVDRLGRAGLHLAIDADHPLRAHRFGQLERRGIGVDHQLRHAVVVAQIDEQQAAVVAHAVHPARKPHIIAHVPRASARRSCGSDNGAFRVSFEVGVGPKSAPDKRTQSPLMSRLPARVRGRATLSIRRWSPP